MLIPLPLKGKKNVGKAIGVLVKHMLSMASFKAAKLRICLTFLGRA